MKKFIGWSVIIFATIVVLASTIIVLLQIATYITISSGAYLGTLLDFTVKKFPLVSAPAFASIAIIGGILLSLFRQWQFPNDTLKEKIFQNRYR